MKLSGQAKKLIIIVGESDMVYQRPLYEAIIYAAKKYKIAGATITKGVLSYGHDNMLHCSKIFSLTDDLPMVIALVDVGKRLSDFAGIASRLMDKAGVGGFIFMEDVDVLRYGKSYD
ncbi:DUF190 domain-containing protein [Thermophagus sp. OGC60D27]|uniref:DUF190 domain-containing protein n=1 Tax=Thermophagus sp. OGC60D27 TaxID=3458415 RepID=UPI00403767A8